MSHTESKVSKTPAMAALKTPAAATTTTESEERIILNRLTAMERQQTDMVRKIDVLYYLLTRECSGIMCDNGKIVHSRDKVYTCGKCGGLGRLLP
jgi:septum formation inhibitor-activating ATPase MinD